MKTLTPDKTGYYQPEEVMDETITAEPYRDKDEHYGADKRLGQTGKKSQKAESENAAAFAEHLEQALLKAGYIHFLHDKIRGDCNLQRECKTYCCRGNAQEFKPFFSIMNYVRFDRVTFLSGFLRGEKNASAKVYFLCTKISSLFCI
jgi:hypothetical protein